MEPCKLVVLISGNGSNLQAIIDAIQESRLNATIAAVISNREDAYGLERAARAGIDTLVIEHGHFASREDFDAGMMRAIDRYEPDALVLAGFMRILSDGFIDHYADRILNIHPSLLPDFKGLDTHQRVLDAGCRQHGASVHYVNKELDSGAVVLQAVIDIDDDEDAGALAARVLVQEHVIYPMVLQWIAERRLHCDNGEVMLDDEKLQKPLIWYRDSLTSDC